MKPLPHDKFKDMVESLVRQGYLKEDDRGAYSITEKGRKNLLENLKAEAETKGLENMTETERRVYNILESDRRLKDDRSVV